MNTTKLLGLTVNTFSLIKGALLIIVVVATIITLLGVPIPVSGSSMNPNFQSRELVVVEKLTYLMGDIERGDVVAARFPADAQKTRLLKRVVGLPGELVELKDDRFYIDGEALLERYPTISGLPPYDEIESILLGPSEYFLVGDNRPGSSDSRLWGPVQTQDIQGRAAFVLFPFGVIRYIDRVVQ